MRVLLIATNRYDRCMSRMQAQPLPIGLAYLAGALAASPHIVKTLDLMFSDDPLGDVQQVVQAGEAQDLIDDGRHATQDEPAARLLKAAVNAHQRFTLRR